MNVIDALALLMQATVHISTLAGVIKKARAEGRDELTPEEVAQIRTAALASELRLEAATR